MGGVANAGSLGRIAGSVSYLSDHRVHHEGFKLACLFIWHFKRVTFNDSKNSFLNILGDLIRDFQICTNGFRNKNIEILGLIDWEKLNLRREDSHENKGKDHKSKGPKKDE